MTYAAQIKALLLPMVHRNPYEKSVDVGNAETVRFSDRLRIAINRAGGVAKMSEKAGVSESVLRKWRAERSEPQLSSLIKIATAADMSVSWLVTGQAPSCDDHSVNKAYDADVVRESSAAAIDNRFTMIPTYDARISARGSHLVESEKVAYSIAFCREWISREFNATPADLYLINVSGESMAPTLRSGDVILIDRRIPEAGPADGIHVMRLDDTLLVKRVQRLPGRRLRMTSDNSAYQAFEVEWNAQDDELVMLGKVVWAGRSI